MYKIKYSKQAIKALRKMPNNLTNRIQASIHAFAKSPHKHQNLKPLKGIGLYRLRVGGLENHYQHQ